MFAGIPNRMFIVYAIYNWPYESKNKKINQNKNYK